MEEYIRKADVLIEALPYIQRFRGQSLVVKFGGSAMEEKAHWDGIMADLTFMECVGMRPILVHGGGKEISAKLKQSGIESRFVKGLRVTCERTIAIVREVIWGEINPRIVAGLRALGARAQGVDGVEVFRVKRKVELDPEGGADLDWGFVGEPEDVNVDVIRALVEQGIIPVITPMGIGADGKPHNINADTAAAAVARALPASKLAFLTDVPGLLRNPEDPASLLSHLRVDEVEDLIAKGVIGGGMLPKVLSGVAALEGGVGKIHMIDGRMPHSLLLEIFTDKGVGTEIVKGGGPQSAAQRKGKK